MSEPLKQYAGTLRPRFAYIETVKDKFDVPYHTLKVQWVNPEGVIVWTETVKSKDGHAFASQITCVGEFSAGNSYHIDEEGKRHFSMKCDPGVLGAPFGEVHMFKGGS